jgi:prefoldin subunit 5
MKESDVMMLVDGVAPAIATLITKAIQPLKDRIEALEQALKAANAELRKGAD